MVPTRYQEIKRPRLYREVSAQIRQQILEGEIEPGDQLPPEQTLAEQFGVSRTVIREAMRDLESSGLLEVVQGSGTFVCEPSSDAAVRAVATLMEFGGGSVTDLHEIREIIEVEMAALAAKRVSERDKAELLALIEEMEENHENNEAYIETDLLFHLLLAKATDNGFFLLILEPIVGLMRQSRLAASRAPGSLERSLDGHRMICKAVVAGNEGAARTAMAKHLNDVRERLEVVEASW